MIRKKENMQKKQYLQKKQKLQNTQIRGIMDAGSTMIETLAAFTVLMVITGALVGIISFSSDLYMKSVDTGRAMEFFSKEIYNKNGASDSDSPTVLVKDCKDTYKKDETNNTYTSFFYLNMSDKTADANKAAKTMEAMPHSISLKDFRARTYTYKEEGYTGVVPSAMEFIHAKDWTD